MYKIFIIIIFTFFLNASLFAQRYGESDDFSYALKLFNEGFYDIAAQQFTLFTNRYPNSDRLPNAMYYKGLSLFNLADYENARIEFQSMAVSYPQHDRSPESWKKVGECYLKLNNKEEAAKAFETVKVLYPGNPNAPSSLYQAADLYFFQKKYNRAETVIKDFLDRYPDSDVYPKGRLLYSRILMENQNLDQAFKELNKVIKSDADDEILAETYLELGKFYAKLGQSQKSIEQFRIVLENYSDTGAIFEAIIHASRMFAKTGELESAVSLINKNSRQFRKPEQKSRLMLELASVYYSQGNYFSARKSLESLISRSSNDTTFLRMNFYMGLIYLKEKKYEKSLYHFKKIFGNKNLYNLQSIYIIETRKLLANLYFELEQFEQGYSELENFLSDYPDEQDRDKLIIKIFNESIKYTKAEIAGDKYSQLLAEFPHHNARDELLFRLGKFYFNQEKYDVSRDQFSELLNNYNCSAKNDSAKIYLNIIDNYYSTDQSVGVSKLARLMGRMLAKEDRQELQIDLAKIYLDEINNISEAIRLCSYLVSNSNDESIMGEAYYILGKAHQRRATLARFRGKDDSGERAEAQSAFKSAMSYISSVRFKDSLAFSFLIASGSDKISGEIPSNKKIKFWKHFISSYPNSRLLSEARVILANSYFKAEDTLSGLKQLDTLHESDDSYIQGNAHFKAGEIYFKQNNFIEASDILKNFLFKIKEHPRRADAYALLARIQEYLGNYKESAQFWNRLSSEYSYSDIATETQTRIPEIFLRAGEFQAVLDFTSKNISEKSYSDLIINNLRGVRNPEYHFYTGKAFFHLKNYSASRKYLLLYIYSQSGISKKFHEETLYLLAKIAINENDSGSALLHLQLIAKNENSPFFIQANTEIADIYFQQGQYQPAQSLYNKLISRMGNSDQKMIFQAKEIICLLNTGQFNSAGSKTSIFKKEYKKSENLKNFLARFEFEKGKYYYNQKNFDTAIKQFESVAGKYKKSDYADDAEYYLGLTYTTLNRVENAQQYLTGFIRKFPNSSLLPNIYITLGGLYYRSEKRELALGAFKKAVELAGENDAKKTALSNLIRMYRDLGLWDGALSQARIYVSSFPDAEDVIDKKIMIGSALINLNRYSEAIDHLRNLKFEANSDQEPEIQFYIGEAYFNAGQYENAIREFVKIPLLSKQTKLQWEASALYYSGQSYEKLGRIGDAIRMYQEIVDRPGILVELKREAQKKIEQLKKSG